MKSYIKKYLLIFLGTLSLALGIIGVFIPILPTTPFLLLTSFCYLRSSKALYQWLLKHKTFGPSLKNYIEHRAIYKRTKIKALFFLWISLVISMIIISNVYLSLLLTTIGLGVTIFILSMTTN